MRWQDTDRVTGDGALPEFEHSGYARGRGFRAFKGGGSEEQMPTASEIAQAKQAAVLDRHYVTTYQPLEDAARRELDTFTLQERAAIAGGRGNADIAQQEQQNTAGLRAALTAGGVDLGSTAARMQVATNADASSAARAANQVQALKAGQQSMDMDRLNVAKMGRDLSMDATKGAHALTGLQTAAALNKLDIANKEQLAKTQAQTQMIQSLGSVAQGVGNSFDAWKTRINANNAAAGGPPQNTSFMSFMKSGALWGKG